MVVTIMPIQAESYNNLIDECIAMEEDSSLNGNVKAVFVKLLSLYFFKRESALSKNLELFFSNFKAPEYFGSLNSITEIDIERLHEVIHGNSINDSVAGSIMLSTQYLKSFYANHSPIYSKLPEDIRFELMTRIKEKNENIIAAFAKMKADIDSDKSRIILTLVALIIKNIHLRTGMPFNSLQKTADEIIQNVYANASDLFKAEQKQLAELSDDKKIKDLVKFFFKVRQFKDISTIADLYKQELGRYQKRTLKSLSKV